MGDVQRLGNRFQTSEFNDLCPLHRGNQLGMPRIALPAVGEQTGQTIVAIPLTSPPNRGFVTLQTGSDRTLTFSRSNGQHDLGSLHLKPGQGVTLGGGMQSALIPASNGLSTSARK
jgi:hypothetical protein